MSNPWTFIIPCGLVLAVLYVLYLASGGDEALQKELEEMAGAKPAADEDALSEALSALSEEKRRRLLEKWGRK